MDILNHKKDNSSQDNQETATFILNIKFRQNKSWQGTIEWIEKKKILNFRSALELIKIIDSTNEQGYQVEVIDTNEVQKTKNI